MFNCKYAVSKEQRTKIIMLLKNTRLKQLHAAQTAVRYLFVIFCSQKLALRLIFVFVIRRFQRAKNPDYYYAH